MTIGQSLGQLCCPALLDNKVAVTSGRCRLAGHPGRTCGGQHRGCPGASLAADWHGAYDASLRAGAAGCWGQRNVSPAGVPAGHRGQAGGSRCGCRDGGGQGGAGLSHTHQSAPATKPSIPALRFPAQVLAVQKVNKAFSARRSCITRTYEYYLPAWLLGLHGDGRHEDSLRMG
ncbi:protein kinase domain-containing protein [Haematococcus lacustris]|uniref:Protein kinase domain-containing protein n=1 Tax=Haematococcus lacustris TaxID=44745 RepID=A0A6A0AD43_HAELA|nr:protein kinase domain-containing protein [Haematococcus lacustris]